MTEASPGASPLWRLQEAAKVAEQYGRIWLRIYSHGIEIQYRRDNLRSQQTVSWNAIEQGINNPLIEAIHEVRRNALFRSSPEGKDAERTARKRRK